MHATMVAVSSGVIALTLLLPQPVTAAQSDWVADPAIQQRLAAGEVVVAASVDPSQPSGRIRAAVRIHAAPEAIWNTVTDCRQALAFVPGLRHCRRLDGAPDGSWQDVEHEMRVSWLLPSVRYVFRAEYDRPRRIDFHRISGDLKEEEGTWRLTRMPDGAGTLVEYEVYLDPGFWIPHALVAHSLRKDIPAVLTGLRACVEHDAGQCRAH
ncbi:MAG: SRPBCC family protein [Candidatus Dormibacteraeota bacterium]|nr:SRPBCC family protein [Candidatus Dormibacteraeota bacterium]